ncbi:MAG: translocation/assembly module TamB [Geobacter sp.]|nr:translocation/assembly module TamB [Geobacter sp.]
MKLLAKTALLAVIAITLTGIALAAITWSVATTQGSRWLLTSVVPLSGISFSAQKIEGRILDHLIITGVRVDLAQQKLESDKIELRWKPLLLLAGTVAVQELVINGVRIQDDVPADNKPPTLDWPRLSERAQLFDGRIMRLRVTKISYRHLQEQPVLVNDMAGSLTWQDGILSITDFKTAAAAGSINGSISAGFKRPSLTADLAIALEQPIAEMNRFTLQARPGHGMGPERFVGTLAIAGSAGTRKRLELGVEAGMAKNAINLRSLRLSRAGQKGLITADGSISFTAAETLMTLQIKAVGIDLAPDLNVPTNLSGTLKFAGTLDNYKGNFTFANLTKGWQSASISADYQGNNRGIRLAPLTGSLLDGSIAGNLDLDWRDGFALNGTINGRNLNPARISPDWKGMANFNATARLAWPEKSPVTGNVSAVILESSLHGQPLTGELKADFAGSNISLARLALRGKGFDLLASGELSQRISLTARINDFSKVIPGSSGSLQAGGWMRWHEQQLSGTIKATGNKLSYGSTQVATVNLSAQLQQGPDYPMQIKAALRDLNYEGYTMGAVTAAIEGTLPQHTVSATLSSGDNEARLKIAAGYKDSIWKGKINHLAGRDSSGPWDMDAPADFTVSAIRLSLSTLALKAGAAERLEVAADLNLKPRIGQVRARWSGLDLSRANPYMKDMQITGNSNGNIQLGFLPEKRLAVSGTASGNGTFTARGNTLAIQRSQLTVEGGERGLQIGMELGTADGGKLKGTFSSPAPLRLALPEKGDLTAEIDRINLALFKPWLPTDTVLEGRISGNAKGIMLPGQRFELDGNAAISAGTLQQQRPDGELNLSFKSAAASWGWRGETLAGTLSLTMAEYGKVRGSFRLPVPAHFPVSVKPQGPLRVTLTGLVREKGLITAAFPEFVQESTGELSAELDIGGSWAVPQIGGKLNLARAGAYLPTAGIHLKEVQLTANLEKDLIRIDSFRALSGSGQIEGTALIYLTGWEVTGYRGSISGKNFQTVNFPELQILSSPKLTFEGTSKNLTVRGELLLPELNIVGSQSSSVIAPSKDVVLEGKNEPAAKVSPLVLDVQVRVVLGEKVHVKVSGIDAQLNGAMDLAFNRFDQINSRGEIKVTKGRYRTYGVNLQIVRGRLFFAGGPIGQPGLDFLALRTIGNVRAGVTVAGTIQHPVTKLYSEPAMPDVDILSYVVLGHPLGSGGENSSLLTQAAGALLTSGQAEVLQDKLKNYLGFSTLEIQDGVGGTSGSTGYKPLQVTAPGAMPAAQQPGVTETVLTVGKYLTPELYISYGKSLFTGNNLFRLRYDFFKNWQIETQTGGGESGADLYYRMEFK